MKKVFITGASRGIGEAIARRLAGRFELVLHAKSESERLLKLASELNAKHLAFDIGDFKACEQALRAYESEAFWGVVLNAGIMDDGTFAGLSLNQWQAVINTNLNGFYNVLKPLVMPMARARAGRIIVMSSVSGVIGNRGQSNYAASKGGLIAAAKSLALELASRGICVNVIAPGLIETDMSEKAPKEMILDLIPAKRIGKPDEVAALAEFLLGENAGYITRQVIGVNGGLARKGCL